MSRLSPLWSTRSYSTTGTEIAGDVSAYNFHIPVDPEQRALCSRYRAKTLGRWFTVIGYTFLTLTWKFMIESSDKMPSGPQPGR